MVKHCYFHCLKKMVKKMQCTNYTLKGSTCKSKKIKKILLQQMSWKYKFQWLEYQILFKLYPFFVLLFVFLKKMAKSCCAQVIHKKDERAKP